METLENMINSDTKKVAKGCGIGCLGMVLAVVLLALLLSFCDSNSGDEKASDEFAADVYAKEFVKDRLKSPSSAKFSSFSDNSIKEIKTNVWEVSGWVDSDNSFGASIRSHFKVTLEYIPSRDTWTLLDINIH